MKFFDYIRAALKNLWRQKLRTTLTIFAIVIGAMAVISMISLVLGARNAFLQQIESAGALTQITVTSSTDTSNTDLFNTNGSGDDGKKLDDATVATLKKIAHITAVTPLLNAYSLRSFYLEGTDPSKKFGTNNIEAYQPDSAFDKQVIAGRNLLPSDGSGVVLLSGSFLEKLGYKDNPQELVGKTVIFTTDKGYSGEGAVIPTPQPNGENVPTDRSQQVTELKAKIVGITSPGGVSGDQSFIPLVWAKGIDTNQYYGVDSQDQKAFEEAQRSRKPGQFLSATPPPNKLIVNSQVDQRGYDSIQLKVDDTTNVEPAAVEIRKLQLGAVTAKEFIDTITRTFTIIGLILGAIGAIALFVASIGVINTMVMATLERTREIGIMRACGATSATVRRLFTLEASLLGFWGGVIGVGAGMVLARIANLVANRMLTQQHIAAQDIISLPLWLALGVIAVTTVIGTLAGLYPAHRAAKLDPVEALRYE